VLQVKSIESKPQRLFGVIKEFGPAFGFVQGQDGGSYFLHWRDLPAPWRPQQYRDQLASRCVTFELGRREGDGRNKATRVFVVDEEDEHRIGAEIDVADVHA